MKTEAAPQPIFLKDYKAANFKIETVDLSFDLETPKLGGKTLVACKLRIERVGSGKTPLALDGERLTLRRVLLNGRELRIDEYEVTPSRLVIVDAPDRFELEIETEIDPQANLSCEGLYKSSGMFCTQCEAESFRRITYFLDRPDVMAVYTVTIRAEKSRYPVLLSNGNLISSRDLGDGRHEAVWKDPHRKPCYLFALVAGDLGCLDGTFKTRSGRDVRLRIFARKGLESRCTHAMESLKKAMKWDEDTYGLEYDLDIFMIVVAEDFNMGAMENKGLNIFNANYILADPQTATDSDFDSITAVVGHEYFHNWTGNRVTCRDWFQLSLKEGLTVFRDQRFSGDMGSEAVKRLEEVIRLRTQQFAEDAGPMAHPVRPASYISIDNFYTLTVYEKGAEVIRMIETLVGRDGFRKGMDLYFKRHDGHAVTTDDFVAAMADANGADLQQFKNWYEQAGTPKLEVRTRYNADAKTFHVTITQSCEPSPGQAKKKPFHIPVAVGLLGGQGGHDLPLRLKDAAPGTLGKNPTTAVLNLREPEQTFVFTDIAEKPVLSFLRGFSAPVRVEASYADDELAFQISHDSDPFARWEAVQLLTVRSTKDLVAEKLAGRAFSASTRLTDAFGPLIEEATTIPGGGSKLDPAFASFMLMLPAEQYLAQFFQTADVDAIHEAREHLMREIAKRYRPQFVAIYDGLRRTDTGAASARDGIATGKRALCNMVLDYLAMSDRPEDLERALMQRREARNMTDELGALQALNRSERGERQAAMAEFRTKWEHEPLVINKWLTIEAISSRRGTLTRIKELSLDPIFDKKNPNKIYALYLAFCRYNAVRFHDKTGDAYRFIADQVMDIDGRNPQVAARLVGAFNQWRSLDVGRQTLIKAELARILAKPGLSSNVFEVATKALG